MASQSGQSFQTKIWLSQKVEGYSMLIEYWISFWIAPWFWFTSVPALHVYEITQGTLPNVADNLTKMKTSEQFSSHLIQLGLCVTLSSSQNLQHDIKLLTILSFSTVRKSTYMSAEISQRCVKVREWDLVLCYKHKRSAKQKMLNMEDMVKGVCMHVPC